MAVVELEVASPRADLILRRPDVLNAMDFEVFDLLAECAAAAARIPDLRVLVVRGEGRSFSSGIDLSALGSMSGTPEELIQRAQEGFRRIAASSIPVIACMQGHALGAGLQLGLVCDLRIAARGTKLGLLEASYGLIPDLGGTTLLPRLVGPARAKKMIWLAERITAEAALEIGLVDAVVESDGLDRAVDELAERIAEAPPTPVREVKALVDRFHVRDTEAGLDAEAAAQERAMTSPDFAEAVMKGMQRRKSE